MPLKSARRPPLAWAAACAFASAILTAMPATCLATPNQSGDSTSAQVQLRPLPTPSLTPKPRAERAAPLEGKAIRDENAFAKPEAKPKRKKVAAEENDPNYVAPTMEYDEIIDPGKKRSMSSYIGSEFALRSERVDRAIQLARRAIYRDPDDMDSHKALAEALDRKLEHQTDKDPRIFSECVKEWLVVMRNGVGLEKGTNWHGIGIFDRLYADDDYYYSARARLKHLTGYVPKAWETNEKYLKRVLRPAQTELKGKILKKSE